MDIPTLTKGKHIFKKNKKNKNNTNNNNDKIHTTPLPNLALECSCF